MKYIKYTYVTDKNSNGPVPPNIIGLNYSWVRSSTWPLSADDVPELFGTCPDDSDINVPGVLCEYSRHDFELMQADEIYARNPVVKEVPRYAGEISLQRHKLVEGELVELADDEGGEESGALYSQVIAIYESMPAGKAKDTMRAALYSVADWVLASPALQAIRVALGLTDAQLAVLFRYADAYRATL